MTTTTTTDELVFTEQVTYIATECPSYCDLPPLHPVDNHDGDDGDFRIHNGPKFGSLLVGYAEEYTHAPGDLRVRVWLNQEATFDDPAGLRKTAEDCLRAAEWLEAQR